MSEYDTSCWIGCARRESRWTDPPPLRQGSDSRDVAEWVLLAVASDLTVDALRAIVKRVVAELKRQYPNISIQIED